MPESTKHLCPGEGDASKILGAGSTRCGAAVRHSITKAGLKKATKVLRAQKQKQRKPQAQAAAEEENILDV